MLGGVVFVSGACLMGLEVVAARVLAPALGNSVFVWGSVISTVLVALSIGYWIGGHVADKFDPLRTLPAAIAGSGLLTVIVPTLAVSVLPSAAELGPRAGSLLASAAIFFAPALLLATVSPMAIRIAASGGLERIGRSAGTLYAVSTAGSVVGTLATAFWLIPLLNLERLIVAVGFTLFATASFASGLVYVYRRRPGGLAAPSVRVRRVLTLSTAAATVLGVVIGVFTLASAASSPALVPAGERILFRKDTHYHRVIVTEDMTERHLRFDRSHQSAMYLDDPYSTSIKYPDYLHLAFALRPDAKRVLVLGLGGGSVVKRAWRDYPWMTLDAVEIDPVVVDVAYRYFEMPEDERVRVIVQDARRFTQTSRQTYDVILVDAYYADALPAHLTTQEFFREAKARMAPDGVLAYNLIGSVEGDRSRLFRSMHRTVRTVWRSLWVFPVGLGADGAMQRNRNIVVLASDLNLGGDELRERIEGRAEGRITVDGFERFGDDLYQGIVEVSDVPLLTDSHAPIDSLIEVN